MKGRNDLIAFLEHLGIAHSTLEHPPVYRVGEGEEFKARLPGAHTKNLFLKDAKDRLWLVSATDRAAIDLKRLPALIGSARLSFGSEARLMDALGVAPGSVTALALVYDERRRVPGARQGPPSAPISSTSTPLRIRPRPRSVGRTFEPFP